MNSILFCWIGSTDLQASRGEQVGLGPIGQAVRDRDYSHVVLLSNYPKKECDHFAKWLGQQCTTVLHLRHVKLISPMDFGGIYEKASGVVEEFLKEAEGALTFHLSPGTSAMAVVWAILAKTKFPAETIASSRDQGVYTVDLPFDLAADYVPKQQKAIGRALQREFDKTTPPEFEQILHRCDAMKRVIARAQRVALFEVPVLLLGESGTGKELFANAIHRVSPRTSGPLETINCGAIPENLIEAELFGSVKGAFTDATDRAGVFERADTGTLFLDEIGDLPLPAQVKLLRTLQTGEVSRVGSSKLSHVDVRVIAATHRNLAKAVSQGDFREDLFHRIAVGVITLPPLRDRDGDIALLVQSRMDELNLKFRSLFQGRERKLSAGARNLLNQHSWPGNIRELFNTVTRAVIWATKETLSADDIRDSLLSLPSKKTEQCSILNRDLTPGFSLDDTIAEVAVHYLQRAQKTTKTKKAAAQLVGFDSAKRLNDWLKKYDLGD